MQGSVYILASLRHEQQNANKRKMMNHIKSETGEIDDDEVLDRLNVKWMKKPDTLQELLEKLERVMHDNGLENIDEQYEERQDYAASQGGQKFVSKATFKKWMDPATRGGRKVKKHSAWEVIKAYVKEHILGIQDNDSEDQYETTD